VTYPSDPANALEGARAVRQKLAEKTRCPPYMHAVFGALMGGLVASEGASDRATLVIELAILLLALLLFIVQRQRLGFFINGYRRGRTRPVAIALISVYLILFSLAAGLKAVLGLHWPALVLGMLMFGLATWGSSAWQARYQAEMAAPIEAA